LKRSLFLEEEKEQKLEKYKKIKKKYFVKEFFFYFISICALMRQNQFKFIFVSKNSMSYNRIKRKIISKIIYSAINYKNKKLLRLEKKLLNGEKALCWSQTELEVLLKCIQQKKIEIKAIFEFIYFLNENKNKIEYEIVEIIKAINVFEDHYKTIQRYILSCEYYIYDQIKESKKIYMLISNNETRYIQDKKRIILLEKEHKSALKKLNGLVKTNQWILQLQDSVFLI